MAKAKRFWLVKSEPGVFSISDLERVKVSGWEGVRNYEARNTMRDLMRENDVVLFYHSNAKPSGIAGLATVSGSPIPDPTQFDKESEYYDPTSPKDAPRWMMVRLAFALRFPSVLELDRLKKEPRLKGMPLLAKGQRLSVQPVTRAQFDHIIKLASS